MTRNEKPDLFYGIDDRKVNSLSKFLLYIKTNIPFYGSGTLLRVLLLTLSTVLSHILQKDRGTGSDNYILEHPKRKSRRFFNTKKWFYD